MRCEVHAICSEASDHLVRAFGRAEARAIDAKTALPSRMVRARGEVLARSNVQRGTMIDD